LQFSKTFVHLNSQHPKVSGIAVFYMVPVVFLIREETGNLGQSFSIFGSDVHVTQKLMIYTDKPEIQRL
jgi:hypothetical protein